MSVNKSSSGEIDTTFEEMGTTRSSRLMANSNEAVSSTSEKNITTKTSKQGLKLNVSYFQFHFIN